MSACTCADSLNHAVRGPTRRRRDLAANFAPLTLSGYLVFNLFRRQVASSYHTWLNQYFSSIVALLICPVVKIG